mgnify:CR=1 FL=1
MEHPVLETLNVSRETSERLKTYVELLRKWQSRINLVAESTLSDVWRRHILDSAQLLPLASPDARNWIDLGSGAGLPGLVLAILLRERAGAFVTLIESNRKKSAFLAEAIRVTQAPARVLTVRIEQAISRQNPLSCDVVTARALASLPQLLNWASPLLMAGAQGLFLKGQDVDAELTEAAKSWNIKMELLPSQSDPSGRIVCVKALASRQPN